MYRQYYRIEQKLLTIIKIRIIPYTLVKIISDIHSVLLIISV